MIDHYTVHPGDLKAIMEDCEAWKATSDRTDEAVDEAFKQSLAYSYTPGARLFDELMAEIESAEQEQNETKGAD